MPGVVDVWGVATRVGVFLYGPEDVPELAPGEILREYRPPEEVFDEASLASLVGVPFTVGHPSDSVTSATWRDLAHGHVLQVEPDGKLVRVCIRIGSKDAQDAIARGMIELSCGYGAELEDAQGITPEGEAYDVIQRGIVYNHLALVDLARAGHVARLKFDGKTVRVQRTDSRKGPRPMKFKFQIDGKTYEVSKMLVPGLSAESEATQKKIRRGDAIETAEVSFTDPDGGAPVKLILPKGTVEEMLTMIGAGSAAPAAPAAPDDVAGGGEPPAPAPPAADPLGSDLEEDEAGQAAAGGSPPRMDAATRAPVAAEVKRQLADGLPVAIQAREDRARERAELERRAGPILGDAYRFDSSDDLDVIVDTIERADASRFEPAKALAAKARKGDDRARGRLDGLLDAVLDGARETRGDSGEALSAVSTLRQNQDAASTGVEEAVPRHEALRRERNDRRSGVKRPAANA